MKRVAVCSIVVAAALGIAVAVSGIAGGKENPKAPDVLIIHGGGTPTELMGKFTPANIDAVSCPTPVAVNCAKVAAQAAEALRAKGLDVRLAEALDVKHRQEILAPRLVVLASPAYFGNASWKMHKMFEERFWEVHTLGGKRLDGRPFATLVTGKSESRCKQTVADMEDVVKSCQGTPGACAIVLLDDSAETIREKVGKLAGEVVAALNKTN